MIKKSKEKNQKYFRNKNSSLKCKNEDL